MHAGQVQKFLRSLIVKNMSRRLTALQYDDEGDGEDGGGGASQNLRPQGTVIHIL